MIVYHGSNLVVNQPNLIQSKKNLDFGKGFYVTTVQSQAERWAKRKAMLYNHSCGIVNLFLMGTAPNLKIQDFGNDLESWIDFVCACRDGSDIYQKYDVILGKVADDKVFRVVDLYKREIWDKTRALQEIRVYETYDQIAFISQKAIDAMLTYQGSYEVAL